MINALVKKTVLTLKYSFYSKKQRRYFFLTWKWMLLCGKKYIFSFRTFFFKTKDGKSLWERKKIFFLSQTAIKTFCESKMMNASQKEKFWSFTNNAEKKRFCESEQHKMIFFAFFFQTMIKSFWESESDKCIAETLLLQSVPHCTATAAPQLIRRGRKKKIAHIDPIPIDPDMEFVQNFTPPDFQAKNFTPSISPNFNSFSKKKTQNN